ERDVCRHQGRRLRRTAHPGRPRTGISAAQSEGVEHRASFCRRYQADWRDLPRTADPDGGGRRQGPQDFRVSGRRSGNRGSRRRLRQHRDRRGDYGSEFRDRTGVARTRRVAEAVSGRARCPHRSTGSRSRAGVMRRALVLALLLIAGAPWRGHAQSTRLESVSWLIGCWELLSSDQNQLIQESWGAPIGNSMLGMSRTVRDGKLLEFESIILRVEKG